MTEDDVVDAVATHLEACGWTVLQKLRTTQLGVDLIANRGTERLLLEAKGGRSLRESSARFGRNFTPSQQRDHVAKAVAVACELRSREPNSRVAIAFPDTPVHRRRIAAVAPSLNTLSVSAFIVHPDQRVEQIVHGSSDF